MDSACVYKVIAMLCVEGFQVRNVLEVVGIDFAILNCIVWSDVICEFLDFQCDSLSGKIIDYK